MQDASGRSHMHGRSSSQRGSHLHAAAAPDHLVLLRGADMEAWESESPMAAVTLPSRPPRLPPVTSGAGLPLPPRTTRPRPPPARPPTLSRTASLPPAVPPRPESTLTSASRRLPASRPVSRPTTPAFAEAAFVVMPDARIPLTPPPVIDPSDISLASPRPEPDRVQNLYVEAPLTAEQCPQQSSRWFHTPAAAGSSKGQSSVGSTLLPHHHHHQKKSLASVHSGRNRSKSSKTSQSSNNSCDSKASAAAAAPPVNQAPPAPSAPPPQLPKQVDSIICIECGKCRCNACQAPKRLPEKWLFGGSVKCSKDSVVDCLSCMCCVKGALYHCGKDCEDSGADDLGDSNPCSCTGAHAVARWTCIGLMSLIMPCLWCYLPLRGCAKATQAVYERCNASGCRCPARQTSPATTTSSPVISSEPASTSSLMSSTKSSSSAADTTSVLSSPLSSPVDPKQRLLE